jgi:tight adherence protein C
MTVSLPFAIAAVSCAGGAWLVLQAKKSLQRAGTVRRLSRVIRDEAVGDAHESELELARHTLTRWIVQHVGSHDDRELRRLLTQLAWRGDEALALFVMGRRTLTLLAVSTALAVGLLREPPISGVATSLLCFTAGALAYLTPKTLLAMHVRRRIGCIRDDVTSYVQLLRVLVDAGLSLDQCLGVLVREGRRLLPALHGELARTLQQIGAGRKRTHALAALADDLRIPELCDLARTLAQIEQYGGSLPAALAQFSEQLLDRRRTDLQERVASLSVKMTLVTALLFFPALLLWVGDPALRVILR